MGGRVEVGEKGCSWCCCWCCDSVWVGGGTMGRVGEGEGTRAEVRGGEREEGVAALIPIMPPRDAASKCAALEVEEGETWAWAWWLLLVAPAP